MFTAEMKIVSTAPYSPSKMMPESKGGDEGWDVFERRMWMKKAHISKEAGTVIIPQIAFHKAITAGAGRLGMKLVNKGKATYKGRFVSGIIVSAPLDTKQTLTEDDCIWISAHADGNKTASGRGTRVPRCFPILMSWAGALVIQVLDDAITLPILEEHVNYAGQFIGVGRWRPENGGYNGRFKSVSAKTI